MQLERDPYWHILLHYRPTLTGSVVSDIDNPSFFLSAEGKRDPAAELAGTLQGFFRPLKSHSVEDVEGHPRCAFPARYLWLKQKLNFEDAVVPPVPCRNFEVFHREFQAESISYIFASYHLGAPASVFGHTFIKLNRPEASRSDLLDYSLNYAANPAGLDPLRYAIYGLLGGYDGGFSILPYHTKVREYNDMENRDMWEYILELSPEQVYRFELHMWELLGSGTAHYFFATENCSYQLLQLLEAAMPGQKFAAVFHGWVIPSETVKLLRQRGLIRSVRYRPSARSILHQRLKQLTENERQYIEDMRRNRLEPILAPTEHNVYLYDTLLTAVQYHKERKDFSDEDQAYYRRLLRQRVQLPSFLDRTAYEPQSTSVDEGHAPVMLRMGGGSDRERSAMAFAFRPIYHDLLNAGAGYPPFSQLEEFAFHVIAPVSMPARLDAFRLLHLLALAPYDGTVFAPSFEVDMGARSVYRRQADYSARGLAGPAFSDPLFIWKGNQIRDDVARDRHPALSEADSYAFGLVERSTYSTVAYLRVLGGASIGNVYDRSRFGYALGFLAGGYGETGSGMNRLGPQGTLLLVIGDARRRFKAQGNCYAFTAGSFCETQFGAAYTIAKNHEIRLEGACGKEARNIFLSYSYFL